MNRRQQAQLLRRYEADAHVCGTDPGNPAIDFYSPFGPFLAKVSAPLPLVERINGYADKIVSATHGKEFVLPQDVVFDGGEDSLANQTANLIVRFVNKITDAGVDEVKFQSFWIVSQYERTPSPIHFHSGDISGVLYLRVPQIANEAEEEAKTYISGRMAGYLNFMTQGRQPYAKSMISFKPSVGDFYLFPGWLLHGAEPFLGQGERRSLAFNAFVPYTDH